MKAMDSILEVSVNIWKTSIFCVLFKQMIYKDFQLSIVFLFYSEIKRIFFSTHLISSAQFYSTLTASVF